MIRAPRLLLLAVVTALVSAACPDPETVGHAPKKQIDMAQERLDKASAKVNSQLEEAAKNVDNN